MGREKQLDTCQYQIKFPVSGMVTFNWAVVQRKGHTGTPKQPKLLVTFHKLREIPYFWR